jgi:hypothetical protein
MAEGEDLGNPCLFWGVGQYGEKILPKCYTYKKF